MSLWLGAGALLAVVAAIVVALPFLRRPGLSSADDRLREPDALERRRLELSEERDRALAALKELEFDHRTGKVSEDDYRSSVGPLRRRAVEALRALEPRAEAVYGGADEQAEQARNRSRERDEALAAKEGEMTKVAAAANERSQRTQLQVDRTAVVEPPNVPEPMPVPSEPPAPVTVPEPSPVPSEPPMPAPAPDPTPEPSPPMPEPPAPGAG